MKILTESYLRRIKFLAGLISESAETTKDKVVKILNSLEFKNDILSKGGDIYAVGGIVRDAVMGKESDDLDIVIRGVPHDELIPILSKYGSVTDTSKQNELGKDFGVIKFVSRNSDFNNFLKDNGITTTIDVALPRKDYKDPEVKGHKGIKSIIDYSLSIEDDLERRDITINSMAIGLDGKVYDKGSLGQEHIQKGVISPTSEQAFLEDPLRMLRSIRFAARFNYDIDSKTADLIRQHAHILSDKSELPRERFLGEFEKMIGKTDLGRAVRLLVELDMFGHIFGVSPKITNYSDFDKVTNVAELSFLLFQGYEPIHLMVKNISNSVEDRKMLEAILMAQEVATSDWENRLLVSQVFGKYPPAIHSNFIPSKLRKYVDELKSGKYPMSIKDLEIDGNDLMELGFKGKEIRDVQELLLKKIYNDELNNQKQEIIDFLSDFKK